MPCTWVSCVSMDPGTAPASSRSDMGGGTMGSSTVTVGRSADSIRSLFVVEIKSLTFLTIALHRVPVSEARRGGGVLVAAKRRACPGPALNYARAGQLAQPSPPVCPLLRRATAGRLL